MRRLFDSEEAARATTSCCQTPIVPAEWLVAASVVHRMVPQSSKAVPVFAAGSARTGPTLPRRSMALPFLEAEPEPNRERHQHIDMK